MNFHLHLYISGGSTLVFNSAKDSERIPALSSTLLLLWASWFCQPGLEYTD